jgi:hypothetical protein
MPALVLEYIIKILIFPFIFLSFAILYLVLAFMVTVYFTVSGKIRLWHLGMINDQIYGGIKVIWKAIKDG